MAIAVAVIIGTACGESAIGPSDDATVGAATFARKPNSDPGSPDKNQSCDNNETGGKTRKSPDNKNQCDGGGGTVAANVGWGFQGATPTYANYRVFYVPFQSGCTVPSRELSSPSQAGWTATTFADNVINTGLPLCPSTTPNLEFETTPGSSLTLLLVPCNKVSTNVSNGTVLVDVWQCTVSQSGNVQVTWNSPGE